MLAAGPMRSRSPTAQPDAPQGGADFPQRSAAHRKAVQDSSLGLQPQGCDVLKSRALKGRWTVRMFLRPFRAHGRFRRTPGAEAQAALPGLFEAVRGSTMVSVSFLPRRGG